MKFVVKVHPTTPGDLGTYALTFEYLKNACEAAQRHLAMGDAVRIDKVQTTKTQHRAVSPWIDGPPIWTVPLTYLGHDVTCETREVDAV